MTTGVRLNAVSLGVTDIARSTAFYEALGWRRLAISTSTMTVLTTMSSAMLILRRTQDLLADANIPLPKDRSAGVTLVMVVNSPEEVHTTLAGSVDAGAQVLRPVTQLGYGSHAYFADHDGHVWEVIETPGFAVDDATGLSVP